MSVARVHHVQHSRGTKKDPNATKKCSKCGDTIKRGDPYRWYTKGFRGWGGTYNRCMKATCTPRPSELESSLLSEVYSAQEDAADELNGMRGTPGDTADIEAIVQNVADSIQSVADQYKEADDALGGTQSTESYERAETLGEAASGLSWTAEPEDPEGCDRHEENRSEDCDDCTTAREEWWDEQLDSAEEAISEVELF